MTKTQSRVYKFIKRYWKEYGHGPSYQNIAEGAELSSRSSAHYCVNRMIDAGYLTKGSGKRLARTIRPADIPIEELIA